MAATHYPRPEGLELDALDDAMHDLMVNGTTTLAADEDSEKWIYWLTKFAGFYEVKVVSHTMMSLILAGY